MSEPRRIDLAAAPPVVERRLAAELAAARLACFPTDTVYGVGGRLTPAVTDAIRAAKGRRLDKPLQVIYPTVAFLERSLELGPRLRDAVRRLLPGPFTLLLPYPPGLGFPPPGEVRPAPGASGAGAGAVATLGVRVPRWPANAGAMASLPFALLASSANPAGGRAPRALDEVDAGLLTACDLILDAGPVAGIASTIVDLTTYSGDGRWRILRRGAVDANGVAALLAVDTKEPPVP